jgi:hypothetical protein
VKALALAVLLATAAQAGDAPLAVQEVDGGVFVPAEVRIAEGKAAADCKAQNAYLTAHLDSNIPVWLVVGIAVAGVLVGGAAGYGISKAIK